AVTVVPWLLSGGPLHLHHGFDAETFAGQCSSLDDGAVILPAAAAGPIAEAGLLTSQEQAVVAPCGRPAAPSPAQPWDKPTALVDVACFGEIGLLAARRGGSGLAAAIPLGAADPSRRAAGAPTVIETSRSGGATLALGGRMVPSATPRPPGHVHALRLSANAAGYVDTGWTCRVDARGLLVTAPPPGITVIGGYPFHLNRVDECVAESDPDATIVALPDAVLGQRFAGTAVDRADVLAKLKVRGVNPLISGAFQARRAPEAA